MKNKNFLICLVGLPASGKSTFANSLKIALNKKFDNLEIKIIDPDVIRNQIASKKFEHEKENIVRNQNIEIIRSELANGNIVISDDLNYYSSMRHDLKEIADDFNLDFFIIHISTPIETCIKWNEKRGKPIPQEVISKIKDKFDIFNRYYWDKPIAIFDLSEIDDLNIVIKDFLIRLEDEMNTRQKVSKKKIIKTKADYYNENLDKITRDYVGTLILNPDLGNIKKKLFKLRKAFIKKNKNKL
ncbi:MAG: AAA family ATPase, partial [Candidatus Odinarchaeota archaeon]